MILRGSDLPGYFVFSRIAFTFHEKLKLRVLLERNGSCFDPRDKKGARRPAFLMLFDDFMPQPFSFATSSQFVRRFNFRLGSSKYYAIAHNQSRNGFCLMYSNSEWLLAATSTSIASSDSTSVSITIRFS